MRVLHVIPSLGPLRGGPSMALPVMARCLAASGVSVDIAATDDNGAGRLDVPLLQPIEQEGYTVRYFPRQSGFYTFSAPLTRWLWRHARNYDVVHVHALFSYPSIAAAAVCAARGVPYIVRPLGTLSPYGMREHKPLFKKVSFRLLEGPLLRRAAAVHYTADLERDEALELGIRTRPAVIPLGLDLSPFEKEMGRKPFLARYPRCEGRTLILFLSRLDPKKGLDRLFPAYADLRRTHPEALLVVAGSGAPEYEAELQPLAEAAGVADEIIWTGFVGPEEKQAALGAADLFVLPSYAENFGIAVVEALAAGLPVVTTTTVGIAGEISAADAGTVISQSKELEPALRRLVEDPALRRRQGDNAARLARERYSLQSTTAALLDLYQSIITARAA